MPKYNNYDNIPAKVFFDIVDTKNFQLLKPKPKEKGLEEIFMCIYDEWFVKSDNEQAKDFMQLHNELAVLHNKVRSLNLILSYIYSNKHLMTDAMYLELIEAIKIGYDIYFDTTLPFLDEMQRVLQYELGDIKDNISFKEAEINQLKEQSINKKFNYFALVDSLANGLAPRPINSNLLLAELVEAEKSLIRKNLKQTA